MSRSRPGFTLIELLIVVVIIGILAAIAIPKFQSSKGKAYWASMRSDLKNVAVAEEAYSYSAQTYTSVLDSLNIRLSTGVQITITQADASGWAALATHPAAYPHTCALFVGGAAPLPPATTAGVVGCN